MNDQEEIDYFKDNFSSSDQNDINDNNEQGDNNSNKYSKCQNENYVSKNNNIFNSNLYSNSFYNKSNNMKNISLSSSFNSYSSTNQGDNFFAFFNSMSSINNKPFPLSFQYKNNLTINSFNKNNNNNQIKSDNQMKIYSIIPKKRIIEMTSENLFIYLTNQEGSRLAQNIINKMKENEVDILLDKISPYLSEIFKDKYGNYFSKKLIQISVPNQRIKIIKNLGKSFIFLSKSLYGTHPI